MPYDLSHRELQPENWKDVLASPNPADREGRFKDFGGSTSDAGNQTLLDQTMQALWEGDLDPKELRVQRKATAAALFDIGPKDALEGMLAAQLIAAHNATMECYRRVKLYGQTFEGRRENLNQAVKLSRTSVMLVEALNHYRGKGSQQKVTVEHVHVHEGGQAVVGVVETRGDGDGRSARGGDGAKPEDQCHAIANTPQPAMRRADAKWQPMSVPGNVEPNGRCRMHGGPNLGAPKGNRNAFKHGRYTAEAIARRREVAAIIRAARLLTGTIRAG